MNPLSEITRVTTSTGDRHLSMMVPVAELLEAIQAEPAKCGECDGGLILEVPVDTPLQWEVSMWHNDGCTVPEPAFTSARPEASGLRLVAPLPGSGKP